MKRAGLCAVGIGVLASVGLLTAAKDMPAKMKARHSAA